MAFIPTDADPIDLFRRWYADARAAETLYPDATTLATVDENGDPDARVVLLKDFDARGFVFYTNFRGAKGRQLLAHPSAALCFYWKGTGRQVRVRGPVSPVGDAEADAYFATRPRESQIGAWASNQSEPISGREELLARFVEYTHRFEGGDVPRPPHWSGFRLAPTAIEFWGEGKFRLHNRVLYTLREGTWSAQILSP